MSTWLWVVIIVAVIVVAIGILSSAIRRRRSEILQTGFGPEYDRTVERAGDRSSAEADLRERQRRHDELELRPLAPLARQGYIDTWQGTQAEFVDDPSSAIDDADRLIQSVMRDRGYPVERLRGARRDRLGRSSDRRRALSPRARHRRRECRRRCRRPRACGARCRTTARSSSSSSRTRPTSAQPTARRCRARARTAARPVWFPGAGGGAPSASHDEPAEPGGQGAEGAERGQGAVSPILNALIWPVLPPLT